MQSISLNSKTYIYSIPSIYFLVWWMYLVYTWDMTTSGISCSRMSQPWFMFRLLGTCERVGNSRLKRIVWICSFFEFPTSSHVMYNSWIWLIFGSCLQSAGSYLWCCHIYGIYCTSPGISYIYLLILEDIHGIWHGYDWDILLWLFIPGIYYIYTVCILFRVRYAEYILKLKNVYIYSIPSIYFLVLWMYLVYTWDMTT